MPFGLSECSFDFPDPSQADPDGLLAFGGDLHPDRLRNAYRQGIFPWYGEDTPILWWSPDPRMVLFPEELKVSKSMKKIFRDGNFSFTTNKAFVDVVAGCAKIPRQGQPGTWLLPDMQKAYKILHDQGLAVSVEVWKDETLVGGLYGIMLGSVFFGESMFSKESNASKAALIYLLKDRPLGPISLVDCQVYTTHLESMGARLVARKEFQEMLGQKI